MRRLLDIAGAGLVAAVVLLATQAVGLRADSITYPKSFSFNEILTHTDLNAQFAAVGAAVNGNLDNGNLKAGAAIVGTKLADAPNGVPASKINADAVTTIKVQDAAITTPKLADNSVTTGKIVDGTIASADILNGTIVNADIADSAINGAKIQDGTIGTADIADSQITTAKIVDGTVATADIGTGQVTGTHLSDGSVASVDITDGTIASTDIADGTVASADIADGTIAAGDLGANAVTTAKILDANVTTAKLAVGATINSIDDGSPVADLGALDLNTERTAATATITTRGGRVLVGGTIGWTFESFTASEVVLTIRLKRSGVTILTYTLQPQTEFRSVLPTPFHVDQPTAGTYDYTVTVQAFSSNVSVQTPVSNTGVWWAVELG